MFSLDVMYVWYFLMFSLVPISWWYTEVHQSLDLAIWLNIVEIIILTSMTGVSLNWKSILTGSMKVSVTWFPVLFVQNLILEPMSWCMACVKGHIVSHKLVDLYFECEVYVTISYSQVVILVSQCNLNCLTSVDTCFWIEL